ncbi:MAG: Beta-glucuronidase [Formosa sp. Hel1_33_131]|nr:MAG: Beta-glucuronidase [Formosa sp. Hel1_33_131]|tara:strand:- start:1077 stop:3902 length:2826 start_codon:yes stop_codon:yes gene_type:complete
MRRTIIYLFALQLVICSCGTQNKNRIDLSGEWKFQIDRDDEGIIEKWYSRKMTELISLPGSMTEYGKGDDVSVLTEWTGRVVDKSWYNDDKYAKYRKEGNVKIPFWLQPVKHYTGAAWYQKEVIIPNNWDHQYVELILERPHWETQVWVDDQKVGMQNSLGTPHVFNLTNFLKTGKQIITICVDNRIKEVNPGKNAHSVSDHTQSNWNGIVGEIYLKASSPVKINKAKLFPDILKKEVVVRLNLKNISQEPQECKLTLKTKLLNDHKNMKALSFDVKVTNEEEFEFIFPMGENPLLWDEFDPNLYEMSLELKSLLGVDVKQVTFGMREFKAEGRRFAINGRPLFLRGTLESSIFPKTGYPPTNIEAWKRILKICKSHGLNHIRFHSWCPPKAAFEAADELGVYLQVECSAWTKIGDGQPIDAWLYKEATQILEAYGNHPSFCLMAYGNEPGGEDKRAFLSEFVTHLIKTDSRHLYTGGAGWPFVEEADFFNNARPRLQNWGQGLNSIINKEVPNTSFDFKVMINNTPMPYVSHEIGQWCVYPNFKEIDKYDGVLKAKNFEIFQETLEENQLGHLADNYVSASGKLQAICYKAEIEAALRTPKMAGFQLLDLHDFPGQGTALVGVLDAFWDEKGYITPEEYRAFCNETVPLCRMQKRVYLNSEEFVAEVEVAHFGKQTLDSPKTKWVISTSEGEIIQKGDFDVKMIQINNCQELGIVKMPLKNITQPKKLHLEVMINEFSNGWDFWVYPNQKKNINKEDIYITDTPDANMFEVLNNGGNVLWTLKKDSLNKEFGGDIKVGFSSIFWNTAWTRGQGPHTLGVFCDPTHEAFSEFPTENHSNWQWWDAMSHGQAIILDKFNSKINPIVRVIDDWFENRSLGLIFEANVGNGKVIISGVDLISDQKDRLEAQQLLYSLKKYMSSDQFNPESIISSEELKLLTDFQ